MTQPSEEAIKRIACIDDPNTQIVEIAALVARERRKAIEAAIQLAENGRGCFYKEEQAYKALTGQINVLRDLAAKEA